MSLQEKYVIFKTEDWKEFISKFNLPPWSDMKIPTLKKETFTLTEIDPLAPTMLRIMADLVKLRAELADDYIDQDYITDLMETAEEWEQRQR